MTYATTAPLSPSVSAQLSHTSRGCGTVSTPAQLSHTSPGCGTVSTTAQLSHTSRGCGTVSTPAQLSHTSSGCGTVSTPTLYMLPEVPSSNFDWKPPMGLPPSDFSQFPSVRPGTGFYLKIWHHRVLSYPFQFIIHSHPNIRTHITQAVEKASLNSSIINR
jgi:hypothetical protein